jgi:hypothetical protein
MITPGLAVITIYQIAPDAYQSRPALINMSRSIACVFVEECCHACLY